MAGIKLNKNEKINIIIVDANIVKGPAVISLISIDIKAAKAMNRNLPLHTYYLLLNRFWW